MRRRHKRHAVSFHPLDNGPRGLRRNSPMPELLAEPTALLALSMWGIAMFFAVWTERIKKDRDLITYREIKDFLAGRTVDRSTERGRRERMIPGWMKIVRTVGLTLLAAAIGAFFGYGGAALVDHLMG